MRFSPDKRACRSRDREAAQQRRGVVEARLLELRVVAGTESNRARAAERIAIGDIHQPARSALGIVESAVANLERLQLTHFHRQPHWLLKSARQAGRRRRTLVRAL